MFFLTDSDKRIFSTKSYRNEAKVIMDRIESNI